MYKLWLPLLLLQLSLSFTARASSPSSPSQKIPITLTEPTNLAPAGESLDNDENGVKLFFAEHGNPIPLVEIKQVLTRAHADVEAHLPHDGHQGIAKSLFETNLTFPDTGDNIYFYVYAYGWGLNYLQLYEALNMLQRYILGNEPHHPGTHSQELGFYVKVAPVVEVARGSIEFTPGARATAKKRNPVTTTLQLPQEANLSAAANGGTEVPISFHVATNLDLNIIELGGPIPDTAIFYTIERAYTKVMLDHDDIEASIPINQPFSFNTTLGRPPRAYITEISVVPKKRASMSWAVLCLSLYGLKDFMLKTKHLNMMKFEITSPNKGVLGTGEIKFWLDAKDNGIGGELS